MLRFRHLLVFFFSLIPGFAAAGGEVELRFLVHAPKDTKSKTIKLVGSDPRLGAWKIKKGLVLKRRREPGKDGRPVYVGRLRLEAGARIKFKLVRSDWDSVEKGLRGGEVANHELKLGLGAEQSIELEVKRWSDGRSPESSACAHVERLGSFGKDCPGGARPVWIHLPPGYSRRRKKPYPVLWMLDGQNVFDRAEAAFGVAWEADDALDALLARGRVEAVVIVAIGNSPARMAEYTPTRDKKYKSGGELEKLHVLIQKELRPFVEKRYQVSKDGASTGIIGSSLGGLAAFHLGMRHPKFYGRVAAVSPSLWWDDEGTRRWVGDKSHGLPRPIRLWLCMGRSEGDGARPVQQLRALVEGLRARGFRGSDMRVVIEAGAGHNEAAWQRRLPRILEYLYPKKG